MHIALIISSLQSGGAERVMAMLANHWITKGHTVTLITLESPKSKLFYSLHYSINLIQLNVIDNRPFILNRIFAITKRLFKLRAAIRNFQPDVIVSFIDIMNITTLISNIGFRVPVIVSERIDPHYYSLPELYTWLRLKIYPWTHSLIVQTESAAKYFPASFRKFIKIISNPVSTPNLVKNIIQEPIVDIISVGRLNPQKDFSTLIHAFTRLSKQYPNLRLTIYGEGNERPALENLINKLGLQEKIFLPGAFKDIDQQMSKADLFIFPSLYEGFPNALCEAMAIGLPIIASNCSGNIDVVRDNIDGRLFPVGDIDALTRVATELIDDYPQRQRLSRNACTITERFGAEHIFKQWDQVIEDVVKK